jgi:hypothetical protein
LLYGCHPLEFAHASQRVCTPASFHIFPLASVHTMEYCTVPSLGYEGKSVLDTFKFFHIRLHSITVQYGVRTCSPQAQCRVVAVTSHRLSRWKKGRERQTRREK